MSNFESFLALFLFTHIHDLSHTAVMNTLPDLIQLLHRQLLEFTQQFCNKWVGNQMHPWALGRKNWLFAASLRSGQRAAKIMTFS